MPTPQSAPADQGNDDQETANSVWEDVPFVSNYYDFPLEGVAHFRGTPHLFFVHDEHWIPAADDPDDGERVVVYALFPIPEDLKAALEEKNAIFERWLAAWQVDPTRMKDHPALPEDRARYNALQDKVVPRLDILRRTPPDVLRTGDFVRDRHSGADGRSHWMRFQVRWTEAPADGDASGTTDSTAA
jgi:hypothetical protein